MRSPSSCEVDRPGRATETVGLCLFMCSLALQALSAAVRVLLLLPAVWLTVWALGAQSWTNTVAIVIGFSPLAAATLTLLPCGGWLWQTGIGARAPSARERASCEAAMARLEARRPGIRGPRTWCVLDRGDPQAAVYGETLMVTRGLLGSRFLEPLLAHELGHLNSSDGRLTAGLHRMTLRTTRTFRPPLSALALVATGDAAAWVMRVPWANYWRSREFVADEFAAWLGEAEGLIEYLGAASGAHDLPSPLMWLSGRSHPPVERRIARLKKIETTGGGHE